MAADSPLRESDLGADPVPIEAWGGDPWCLVFEGTNGSGKSWAATRVFRLAAERLDSKAPIWISAKEYATRLREAVRGEADSPTRAIAEAKLLLIDDMRAARSTDYVADELEYVLKHRDDYLLPTIVTLETRKGLPRRILSRLSEPYSRVVTMPEFDRRLR